MPESPTISELASESPPAEARTTAAAFVQRVDQWMAGVSERLESLTREVVELKRAIEKEGGGEGERERSGDQQSAGDTSDLPLSPSSPVAPSGDAPWQRAIFGPSLAADPALLFYRNELLRSVLQGEAAAVALAGQLLVFQAATAEKKPTLLKEIGEAFYRWRPKHSPGGGKMELALADWLQEACQQGGAANTIELVEPGQRFDAARHSAAQRGVEIAAVQGWVVLRDNGKVYTKAAVAVK
jgi:hypothetical protein